MLRGKRASQQAAEQDGAPGELSAVKARQDAFDQQLADIRNSQQDLSDALVAQVQRLEEEFAQRTSHSDELAAASAAEQRSTSEALRKDLQSSCSDLGGRCDAVQSEIVALRAELSSLGASSAEVQGALERRLGEGLEKASGELETKLEEVEERCRRALADHAAASEAESHSASTKLGSRCEVLQGGLDEVSKRIGQVEAAGQQAHEQHAGAVDVRLEALKREIDEQLASLREVGDTSASEFATTKRDLAEKFRTLAHTRRLAENLFTRTLVWHARGFKKRLSQLLESDDQVIRSPGFSLSGLPAMKIEVQMASMDDIPDSPSFAPSLPLPGSCSVGIWGPPGQRLMFQLTLGEGSAAVTRRFDHFFQPGGKTDSESRVLFIAQNVCRLNQVWIREQDLVRVSFELLEVQGPAVNIAAPPAIITAPSSARSFTSQCSGDVAAGAEDDNARRDADASATASVPGAADEGAPGAESAQAVTSLSEDAGAAAAPSPSGASQRRVGSAGSRRSNRSSASVAVGGGDDSIEVYRGMVAQELVRERLSSELLAVKNRSVRRVEWTLEGCARLLECRVGEAVDSPVFSAAGLERIQLHFYPRDVSATGSSAQPCALYVSGPSRTTLKGMMFVGTQSRPLEHRYQRRGDTAGRSRFCQLEHQVDCTDRVTLALEIIEVETDLHDQASSSLCLRDARTGAGAPTAATASPGAKAVATASPGATGFGGEPMGGASPLHGTKGTLRMKRDDPSKTEEFVKCVSLPTLNARQLKLPLAMKGAARGH